MHMQLNPLPAHKFIAGSSEGDSSPRETASDMLKALEILSDYDCSQYWRDIAIKGDDDKELSDMQYKIALLITEKCPLSDYCTIELIDGEWTVTPYIDHDLPKLSDIPKKQHKNRGMLHDHILVTNKVGNVNLLRWNKLKKEYVSVWVLTGIATLTEEIAEPKKIHLCSARHVAVLAEFCNHYSVSKTFKGKPSAVIAEAFAVSNVESVNSYYPDDANMASDNNYIADCMELVAKTDVTNYPAVQVIKLAQYYIKQCCEHEEWSESITCDLIRKIFTKAVTLIPGYDSMSWEV